MSLFLGLALFFTMNSTAIAGSDLLLDQMPKLDAFYRDLHEHPELSSQEVRTAKRVAEEFRGLGLEVIEGIGGTGVVGILRNGEGPATLVRSELDGLPIQEATGLSYSSKNAGVMHACGHDFHTAALFGAAYMMGKTKDNWKGTLIFLAQPAEETLAGAKAMIAANLLKKIPKFDQAVALHSRGTLAGGTIGFYTGRALAASTTIEAVVRGRGGHAAAPHMGVDPIVLAAEAVLKLQTLVGREVDPVEPALITVGAIHGGTKSNIIPDEVLLKLTIRAHTQEIMDTMIKRVQETFAGIARTANAPAPDVKVLEGSPPLVNDPKLSLRFRNAVEKSLGAQQVVDLDPIMGGEDFGAFGGVAKKPSLFFMVGTLNPKDNRSRNHSAYFMPDFEKNGPNAIRAMVAGLSDLHKKN